MKNNIYVLYNRLSNRYGDVISFASDAFAVARIQPTLEKNGQLEENELCRVGKIDIENGTIETEQAPIRIAWRETIENKPTKEI